MTASIKKILKPTKYRAVDTSGNNNHGQIYSGRALEFDGVSDRFATTGGGTVGTPSTDISGVNYFADGNPWTMAVWLYVNGRQDAYIIGKDQNTRPHLYLDVNSSVQYLDFRANDTGNDFYRFGRLQENVWHRLVVISNGTTISAYSNGVLIGTITDGMASTDSSGSFTTTEMWFTGWGTPYESGSEYKHGLDGMMSDAQVWDIEWTESDVTFDYLNPESLALNNGGTSLTESNLKLWYSMQDGHRGQQSYIFDGANTGLGSELITNGDFSDNTSTSTAGGIALTGWTNAGISHNKYNNVSISNGQATLISDGSDVRIEQTILTVGVTYKYSIDIISASSGAIKLQTSASFDSGSISTVGTHTGYFTADATVFRIRRSGACNVTFDNVSIKPVNDKHHATTVFEGDNLYTAANALKVAADGTTADETDATTGWTAVGTSAHTTSSTAHSGSKSMTYTANANNGRVYADLQSYMTVGRTYKLSIFARHHGSGGTQRLRFSSATDMTSNVNELTNGEFTSSDTTFAEAHLTFVYDDNKYRYFGAKEYDGDGSTGSGGLFMDTMYIKEVGVASGWTDADQQLDIAQTALQSYNQLAWFPGQEGADADLNSQINTSTNSWSFSFWLFNKDTTQSFDFIIGSSSNRSLAVDNNSDRKLYYRDGDGDYNALSDAVIPQGEWVHIVVTAIADTSMTAYINGEAQTTNTSMTYDHGDGAGSVTDTQLIVDRFMEGYSGNYESLGCITEISYYNDVLTLAEAQDLYNYGKAKSALEASGNGNLVGYWRNNGLAQWDDLKGSNHVNVTTNVIDTLLLPAGVDATRDNQGFLMNRQKNTNSLNLPDVGDAAANNTDNVYVNLNSNPLVTSTIGADHNPFSISCWIKPRRTYSAGPHAAVWLGESGTSFASIAIEDGETAGKSNLCLSIDMNNPTRPTYRDVITNSEWNHIVISCESGTHTGINTQNGHALSGEPLVDSAANYAVDELIGALIENNTQSAYGKITDNNATQIASTGAYMSSGTLTFETGTVGLSQEDGTDKPHNNANAYNVIKVYINGVCNFDLLDFDDSGSPSSVDNDGKYYIGTDDAANRQFVGKVDDVLVYDDKWLTQKEVTRIYNAGKRSHR